MCSNAQNKRIVTKIIIWNYLICCVYNLASLGALGCIGPREANVIRVRVLPLQGRPGGVAKARDWQDAHSASQLKQDNATSEAHCKK